MSFLIKMLGNWYLNCRYMKFSMRRISFVTGITLRRDVGLKFDVFRPSKTLIASHAFKIEKKTIRPQLEAPYVLSKTAFWVFFVFFQCDWVCWKLRRHVCYPNSSHHWIIFILTTRSLLWCRNSQSVSVSTVLQKVLYNLSSMFTSASDYKCRWVQK